MLKPLTCEQYLKALRMGRQRLQSLSRDYCRYHQGTNCSQQSNRFCAVPAETVPSSNSHNEILSTLMILLRPSLMSWIHGIITNWLPRWLQDGPNPHLPRENYNSVSKRRIGLDWSGLTKWLNKRSLRWLLSVSNDHLCIRLPKIELIIIHIFQYSPIHKSTLYHVIILGVESKPILCKLMYLFRNLHCGVSSWSDHSNR